MRPRWVVLFIPSVGVIFYLSLGVELNDKGVFAIVVKGAHSIKKLFDDIL